MNKCGTVADNAINTIIRLAKLMKKNRRKEIFKGKIKQNENQY